MLVAIYDRGPDTEAGVPIMFRIKCDLCNGGEFDYTVCFTDVKKDCTEEFKCTGCGKVTPRESEAWRTVEL